MSAINQREYDWHMFGEYSSGNRQGRTVSDPLSTHLKWECGSCYSHFHGTPGLGTPTTFDEQEWEHTYHPRLYCMDQMSTLVAVCTTDDPNNAFDAGTVAYDIALGSGAFPNLSSIAVADPADMGLNDLNWPAEDVNKWLYVLDSNSAFHVIVDDASGFTDYVFNLGLTWQYTIGSPIYSENTSNNNHYVWFGGYTPSAVNNLYCVNVGADANDDPDVTLLWNAGIQDPNDPMDLFFSNTTTPILVDGDVLTVGIDYTATPTPRGKVKAFDSLTGIYQGASMDFPWFTPPDVMMCETLASLSCDGIQNVCNAVYAPSPEAVYSFDASTLALRSLDGTPAIFYASDECQVASSAVSAYYDFTSATMHVVYFIENSDDQWRVVAFVDHGDYNGGTFDYDLDQDGCADRAWYSAWIPGDCHSQPYLSEDKTVLYVNGAKNLYGFYVCGSGTFAPSGQSPSFVSDFIGYDNLGSTSHSRFLTTTSPDMLPTDSDDPKEVFVACDDGYIRCYEEVIAEDELQEHIGWIQSGRELHNSRRTGFDMTDAPATLVDMFPILQDTQILWHAGEPIVGTNGYIYFTYNGDGDDDHGDDDGTLWCYSPFRAPTDPVEWQHRGENITQWYDIYTHQVVTLSVPAYAEFCDSSPAISICDNRIYYTSKVYAREIVDKEEGIVHAGVLLWALKMDGTPVDDYIPIYIGRDLSCSSPVVDRWGNVYVTGVNYIGGNNPCQVYLHYIPQGDRAQASSSIAMTGYYASTPALGHYDDSLVYYLVTDYSEDEYLVCVDPMGANWPAFVGMSPAMPMYSQSGNNPIYSNGYVIVGNTDGLYTYASDNITSTVWEYTSSNDGYMAYQYSSPAVRDGIVYVAQYTASSAYVAGYSLATGLPVYASDTFDNAVDENGNPLPVQSSSGITSPCITDNGQLFLATYNDLLMIDTQTANDDPQILMTSTGLISSPASPVLATYPNEVNNEYIIVPALYLLHRNGHINLFY
ncbi:PQQ-like beta-propeller repeat protein [bacterium]|nr:PQQ-like beta-propeller repeat protein [bacterium]